MSAGCKLPLSSPVLRGSQLTPRQMKRLSKGVVHLNQREAQSLRFSRSFASSLFPFKIQGVAIRVETLNRYL